MERLKEISKEKNSLQELRHQTILKIAQIAEKLPRKEVTEGNLPLLLEKSDEIIQKIQDNQNAIDRIHKLEVSKEEGKKSLHDNKKELSQYTRELKSYHLLLGQRGYQRNQQERGFLPDQKIATLEKLMENTPSQEEQTPPPKGWKGLLTQGKNLVTKGSRKLQENRKEHQLRKLGQFLLEEDLWESLDLDFDTKQQIGELKNRIQDLSQETEAQEDQISSSREELKNLQENPLVKENLSLKKVLENHRLLLGREFLDTIAGVTPQKELEELLKELNSAEEKSLALDQEKEEIEKKRRLSALKTELEGLEKEILNLENNLKDKKALRKKLQDEQKDLEA